MQASERGLTFTAATATPTTEFKFPTNGDLSHSPSNGHVAKSSLEPDKYLLNGTRESHEIDCLEKPDVTDGVDEEDEEKVGFFLG